MVYLVRTSKVLKFDEELDRKTKNLIDHLKSTYPQIREMRFLWNVTGLVNELHWVMTFDSLADEEAFGNLLVDDEKYTEWWMEMIPTALTPFNDRLYKDARMWA